MPLFEYACRDCGGRFEQFVTGEARPACPACDSRAVRKLLSVFAVSGGGSRSKAEPTPAGCGSCGDPRGPGSCQN